MNRRQKKGLPRILVSVCFFLSGAAGLMYEIVWMRMLGLVFGHTVFALTAVLAAFMAGLALGAYVFGKLIDRKGRPLQVYGLLEAGIGLYVLVVPFLFSGAQVVYLKLYRLLDLSFFTFALAQFALVLVILLIPTTLMGASLPVLVKFFADRLEGIGRKVGDLYALNTLGAVFGSAAAGFILLPFIGVQATTLLAAAINVAIGVWALVADALSGKTAFAITPITSPPQGGEDKGEGPAGETTPTPAVLFLVLAGTALSGAASMVYEVAWSRALRMVIASSTYAFSAMLTTFLVGLALGSFLFARLWGRRPANGRLFGWIEIAIGFSALGLIPIFERLPGLVLTIFTHFPPSASGALLVQFGLSFLVMIVPTTLIGAAFPCAVQICAQALPRLGRDVGRVYSVNTVGTLVGAVFAGFFLIPTIGAQASMITAAAINAGVGAAVLFLSELDQPVWRRAVAVCTGILFVTGLWMLPRWNRNVMVGGVSIYAQRFIGTEDPAASFRARAVSQQLLYYREGINSTVSVEQTGQMRSLKVDGKVDASNGMDMVTQLLLGYLPLFLHQQPERVLIIGLGSGVTAGAVAQHAEVRKIDIVEMEPAVREASNFFIRENRNVLRDPRTRLVIGDGRNFILAGGKKYDVISSEPSNPWMAGVANLFSLEFYQIARQRLAENGIMIQWVHSYSLFPKEFKMIVNTFREVFPNSTLWRTLGGDYLLAGTLSPLRIDYALVARRMEAAATIKEDMKTLHLESPLDLFTLFLLDEGDLARFANGAAVNSDDQPLVEFAAPFALYAQTIDMNKELLAKARSMDLPPVVNLAPGLLDKRRLHFARAYWARGEKEEALKELRKAEAPKPGDIAAQMERAKLLFSLSEIGQASEALSAIARLKPNDPLIQSYLKAAAILRRLKAEEAVMQHGRTRFGNPNPAEAHNNLGVLYTRLGIRFGEPAFFDLAVDSLEAALRIEPQTYAVLNNLGNAYFELGKLEEAAGAYQQVIRLMPYSTEARFNLGLVYEKQGKVALAAREFERAAVLNPYWELPRMGLKRLRGKVSEPTETGKFLGSAPQVR